MHHSFFLRPLSASSQLQAVTTHISKELGLDKHSFSNIQTVPKQQHPDFWNELLKLEEMFVPDRACIGLVDSTTHPANDLDTMMTAVKTPSESVNQLLDNLGKRVNLAQLDAGLGKFSGLANIGEPSGVLNSTETVLTRMLGVDIVFHVSSLLPYDTKESVVSNYVVSVFGRAEPPI